MRYNEHSTKGLFEIRRNYIGLTKRLSAVTLGAVLLCPVTAYAARSQEALELYKAVEAKNRNMMNVSAFYNFKTKITDSPLGNGSTNLIDMWLEMNMKMNHIQDPSQLHYMAYHHMTIPGSEPITYSMYYLDGYTYTNTPGQKIEYPMAMGDTINRAMASSKAFEAPGDLAGDFNLWDKGENKVIGYTISDTRVNEYVQMILGSTELTDMLGGPGMKLRDIRGEYVVNPVDDCIKIHPETDMNMTMQGETFNVSPDGDVGITDLSQLVDASVLNPAERTEIQAAAS